jgi:hypothetical protein
VDTTHTLIAHILATDAHNKRLMHSSISLRQEVMRQKKTKQTSPEKLRKHSKTSPNLPWPLKVRTSLTMARFLYSGMAQEFRPDCQPNRERRLGLLKPAPARIRCPSWFAINNLGKEGRPSQIKSECCNKYIFIKKKNNKKK